LKKQLENVNFKDEIVFTNKFKKQKELYIDWDCLASFGVNIQIVGSLVVNLNVHCVRNLKNKIYYFASTLPLAKQFLVVFSIPTRTNRPIKFIPHLEFSFTDEINAITWFSFFNNLFSFLISDYLEK